MAKKYRLKSHMIVAGEVLRAGAIVEAARVPQALRKRQYVEAVESEDGRESPEPSSEHENRTPRR